MAHVAAGMPIGNVTRARRDDSMPIWEEDAMRTDETEDTTIYIAVVNAEEQYSMWPKDRPLPAGWNETGASGTRVEVLDWIRDNWSDMRPLSLRKKMDESGQQ